MVLYYVVFSALLLFAAVKTYLGWKNGPSEKQLLDAETDDEYYERMYEQHHHGNFGML